MPVRSACAWAFAWLLAATASVARASSPPLFATVNDANGLPSNAVLAIAIDRDGYPWVATDDGLARWDGVSARVWRPDPRDPAALPAAAVESLFIDSRDRVLVGFEDEGLAWLEPDRAGFRRLRPQPEDPEGLPARTVWALAETRDGSIWIGTFGGGLHRWRPEGGIDSYRADDPDPLIVGEHVVALHVDRGDRLWVATERGLSVIEPAEPAPRLRLRALEGAMVTGLGADHEGRVIAGVADGVLRFDSLGGPPRRLAHPQPRPGVRAVLALPDGSLAFAVRDGIDLLHPGGRWTRWPQALGVPRGQPLRSVRGLLLDPEGNFWAGGEGGLARVPVHAQQVQWLRAPQFDPTLGDPARSVAAACPDGSVLAFTLGGVLERHGPAPGAYARVLDRSISPALATSGQAYAAHCDGRGRLLLGVRHGLVRIDPHTRGVEGPAALGVEGFVDLIREAPDGALWVSVLGGALHRLVGDRVEVLEREASQRASEEIEAIAFDAEGTPWIAGSAGIERYDASARRFRRLEGVPVLRHDTLLRAADGSWWAHRPGRLFRFRVASDRIHELEAVGPDQGLPVAEAGDLIEARGAIWLLGLRGLWRYDPRNRALHALGSAEALPVTRFPTRPVARIGDELVAPTLYGLARFDPARLAPPATRELVRLHAASVVDAAGHERPLRNGDVLRHDDRELRFEVRVLSFADPEGTRYRFRATGAETSWVETGSQPARTWSSLPAGRHRLDVQTRTAGGPWRDAEVAIDVEVAPPPWASRPAQAGYALALVALLVLAVRRYRRALERRHARTLAATRRAAAEAQLRARTEFLADVGHEIRTPMSGVLGMTELLLRTPLDTRQRDYALTVRRAGEHLLALVDELLELSRIEAGRLEWHARPVDPRALLEDIATLQRPIALAKGLALTVETTQDVPAAIEADPVRLRQIVLNLVANAVRYTRRGRVELRASRSAEALHIAVVDTGPGFTPEARARLYERYERGRETGRRGGTGLGLAIARRIVEHCGGRLELETESGRGSTFTVILPLVEASVPVALGGEAPANDPSTTTAGARTVLVVEDDDATRAALCALLRADGHAALEACHALDALRIGGEQRFDLALIDLDLPGLDGLRLLPLLRRHAGEAWAAIAMTARVEVEDAKDRAQAAGFDGFLRKPVLPARLAELVRETQRREAPAGVD